MNSSHNTKEYEILNQIDDAIFELDNQGIFLFANSKIGQWLNKSPKDIVGKHILTELSEERNTTLYISIEQALKDKVRVYDHVFLKFINDFVLFKITPSSHGIIVQISETLNNTKIYGVEFLSQLHFNNQVMEMVPNIFSVTELPSRKIIYCNNENLIRNGYDREELLQMSVEERKSLMHPEDLHLLNEYYESFNSQTKDGEIHTIHYRAKNKSGVFSNFIVKGRILERNEDSSVRSILNVIQNITEQKKSEQEILQLKDEILQRATEKYSAIFNSINDAFVIIDIIIENGIPVDFKYLEANAAFEKYYTRFKVIGKTFREIAPGAENKWIEKFGQVAVTGESISFEDYSATGSRWANVTASKIGTIGDTQVAVIFNEITEVKRQEQQQNYLLKLSDALRSDSDPVGTEEKLTQIAMDYFDSDRCYYCTIEEDNAVIRRDALREGLPSVAGNYPLSSFTLFKKIVDEGQPFIVHDVRTTDILDEPLRELCIQLQVISFIDIPIRKYEKVVGVLCIVQSTPRKWTDAEVQLAISTAERTWAAVERARVEEELRSSEERLKKFNESLEMIVDERTAELQESKELLQGIINAPNIGLVVYKAIRNKNGDIIDFVHEFVNQRTIENMGQDITGWKLTDHGKDGIEQLDAFIKVIQTGISNSYVRHITLNDTEIWYMFINARLNNDRLVHVWEDITEIKKSEKEIKASKELLHAIATSQTISLNAFKAIRNENNEIIDLEWTFANPITEMYANVTSIVGKKYLEVFSGSYYEKMVDTYREVIETGVPNEIEFEYSINEVNYWFRRIAVKLGDGILVSAEDITERKRQEIELSNTNEKLKAIFEKGQMQLGYYAAIRNEEGVVIDFIIEEANPASNNQLNKSLILSGNKLSEILIGLHKHPIWERMIKTLETGEAQRFEEYMDFPMIKGWYDFSYIKLGDGIISQSLNISERKEAEQKILETNHFIEEITNTTPDIIYVFDSINKKVLYVNERASPIFGYSQQQLCDLEICMFQYFCHPEDLDKKVQHIERFADLKEGEIISLEIRLKTVNGDYRWFRIRDKVFKRNDNGDVIQTIGVGQDITDQKQAEVELLKLRLSQQKEILSAVMNTQEDERKRISESLHNGLGQLLYAVRMRADSFQPDTSKEGQKELKLEVDQLLEEAIDQTRNISHQLSSQLLETYGLKGALEEIVNKLKSDTLLFNLKFIGERQRFDPDLEMAVFRIVQELANNVVKHSKANIANIRIESNNEKLTVIVKDSGIGFEKSSANKKNGGMGLSMIENRVKLLNGTMTIESDKDAGTRVAIVLTI